MGMNFKRRSANSKGYVVFMHCLVPFSRGVTLSFTQSFADLCTLSNSSVKICENPYC